MNKFNSAIEAFTNSPEFIETVKKSTRAGFGGDSYSVELFENGEFRTAPSSSFGNKYTTPGVIVPVPQLDDDWAQLLGTDEEYHIGVQEPELIEEFRQNTQD